MISGEIFTIPADGNFHSLRGVATKSFGVGGSPFLLTTMALSTDGTCVVRLYEDDPASPEFMLGGDFPSSIDIDASANLNFFDVFVKAEGTDATFQVVGTGAKDL